MLWKDGKLIRTLARRQPARQYEAAYAIGSGNHGKSYLIRIGDSLFQSPLAWYTGAPRPGTISPGYQEIPLRISTGPSRRSASFVMPARLALYAARKTGIWTRLSRPRRSTCERCHGDPSRHLSGEPRPASIVNPAKLPQRPPRQCLRVLPSFG